MNEAWEAEMGNVTRGAEDAFEVPDCFGACQVNIEIRWFQEGGSRVGIDLIQEAAAIILVEDACEAPWLLLEWLHVLYFDDEHVAWLCALYLERTA